jgi:hypothetical protein
VAVCRGHSTNPRSLLPRGRPALIADRYVAAFDNERDGSTLALPVTVIEPDQAVILRPSSDSGVVTSFIIHNQNVTLITDW